MTFLSTTFYHCRPPLLLVVWMLLLLLIMLQLRLDSSCSAFGIQTTTILSSRRNTYLSSPTSSSSSLLLLKITTTRNQKNFNINVNNNNIVIPKTTTTTFTTFDTNSNNNNRGRCHHHQQKERRLQQHSLSSSSSSSPTSLFSHHQSNNNNEVCGEDDDDDQTTTIIYDNGRRGEKGKGIKTTTEEEEVELLKERAKKARQEAIAMEESYVEQKIQNLEEKLLDIKNKQLSNNSENEQQYLVDKINSLKTYLSSSSSSSSSGLSSDAAVANVDDAIAAKEKQQQDEHGEEDEIVSTTNDDDDDEEKKAKEQDYVGVLSDDEMKVLNEVQGIFNEFQDIFNTSLKIAEQTGIEIDDDDDDNDGDDTLDDLKELEDDLQNAMAGNITSDDLDLIMSVMGFVNFIQRIPGVKSKYTELKSQFVEMFQYLQESNFTKDDFVGGVDGDDDEYYFDRVDAIMKLIPNGMVDISNLRSIGYDNILNDTDIEEFVTNIMLSPTISKDVFQITSRKPRKLLKIGYIIEGIPREKDGDVLVSKINEQLNNHYLTTKTSGGGGGGGATYSQQLVDKLQFFYIRDPSKSVGLDDVQIADMLIGSDEDIDSIDINGRIQNWNNAESPCLLVLPKQLTPNPASPLDYRLLISAISIILTINFVGGSCYGSDNLLKSFYLAVIAHPTILVGLVGLSFVHDIGHYIAAAMNKLRIAVPSTIIPSPSTGILGTSSTSLLTSPKNNKSYYDFAISGPLFGFVTSWILLVMGLQQTLLVTKSAEINQLPHLPLDFFKLSLLTSSTIESFMGTDVLLSIDPLSEPNVAIHPLAIIGHIGILVNALSLLPTSKTSDGGRMLQSSFGRFSIADQLVSPLMVTFLVVQAFRVWSVSNYLAIYFFLGNAFNDDVDVPCRNDVDPAGGIRAIVFVLSLMLAAIAISPAF